MNHETLALALGLLVLALAFLAATLPWRKFAERWVGNNPARATVYVRDGEDLHPVRAKLAYLGESGTFYQYAWQGTRAEVLVGPAYPVRYLRGSRLIAVDAGSLRATDLPLTGETDHSYLDVGSVVQGRVMVHLVEAVTGPQRSPWLWVLIGAGVLVGAYFLGMQFFPEQMAELIPGSAPSAPTTAEVN